MQAAVGLERTVPVRHSILAQSTRIWVHSLVVSVPAIGANVDSKRNWTDSLLQLAHRPSGSDLLCERVARTAAKRPAEHHLPPAAAAFCRRAAAGSRRHGEQVACQSPHFIVAGPWGPKQSSWMPPFQYSHFGRSGLSVRGRL